MIQHVHRILILPQLKRKTTAQLKHSLGDFLNSQWYFRLPEGD